MIHKTPVVVTRKGGVTTVVKDEVNGYLVRPKSANMIANHVNMLLNDDKLRHKMAETAYKTVCERFSWEHISEKFYNMYDRAIHPLKRVKPQDSIILSVIKKFRSIRDEIESIPHVRRKPIAAYNV
jgi:glycogen synthase